MSSLLDHPVLKAAMATHEENKSFWKPVRYTIHGNRVTFFNAGNSVCGQMSKKLFESIKKKKRGGRK